MFYDYLKWVGFAWCMVSITSVSFMRLVVGDFDYLNRFGQFIRQFDCRPDQGRNPCRNGANSDTRESNLTKKEAATWRPPLRQCNCLLGPAYMKLRYEMRYPDRYSFVSHLAALASPTIVSVSGFQLIFLPDLTAMLPRWQTVALRWPMLISAAGVSRDFTQSIKFPTWLSNLMYS